MTRRFLFAALFALLAPSAFAARKLPGPRKQPGPCPRGGNHIWRLVQHGGNYAIYKCSKCNEERVTRGTRPE